MITSNRRRDDGSGRLLEVYRTLDEGTRHTLLEFAEFLASRAAPGPKPPLQEPDHEPRPPSESVVGAIKRLSRTYSMLDRGNMLTETSSLMSAHVLHGRPATVVIDELEALFERHYTQYRKEQLD